MQQPACGIPGQVCIEGEWPEHSGVRDRCSRTGAPRPLGPLFVPSGDGRDRDGRFPGSRVLAPARLPGFPVACRAGARRSQLRGQLRIGFGPCLARRCGDEPSSSSTGFPFPPRNGEAPSAMDDRRRPDRATFPRRRGIHRLRPRTRRRSGTGGRTTDRKGGRIPYNVALFPVSWVEPPACPRIMRVHMDHVATDHRLPATPMVTGA